MARKKGGEKNGTGIIRRPNDEMGYHDMLIGRNILKIPLLHRYTKDGIILSAKERCVSRHNNSKR